jgi:hypothetical protein
MAVNQGIGNAELKLAGRPTKNANQFFGSNYLGAQKLTGYTGTKRQIAGDVANTALTVATPGISKGVEKSFAAVAPKVIPKIVPKAVANAGTGAIVGGPMNVASYVSSDQPITKKGVTQSFRQGAQAGAVLGAAGTVAGHVAPEIVNRVKSLPRNQRLVAAQGAAESKPLARLPVSRLASTDASGYGELDPARVDKYKQQIAKTGKIEPILAMRGEGGKLFVEDGKHRLAAAKALGLDSVPGKIVTPQEVHQRAQGGYIALPGKRGATSDNVPKGKTTPSPATLAGGQKPVSTSNHLVSSEPSLLPNAEQRVFAQNPMASGASAQMQIERVPTESGRAPVRGVSDTVAISPPSMRPLSREQSSPVQSQVNNLALPEFNTKRVGNLDRVFRSTRSVIERQGAHGKQLAGMLQGARDTEEIYQAQIAKQIPTVRSLKGKAFENFVEATQGLAKPINTKVVQAIKEWQAVHPSIRNRAVAAGLDVGDLGPNYYPHFIDYEKVFKDKNTYNEAINHLVQTGQAASQEDAIKLLGFARETSRNRSFGNLEASRQIDLPFYDKTPNSLNSYIGGSTKRIANTETFGKGDENALKLIAQAGQQGYDTEAMKNAFDVAVGAKKYGAAATKVSNTLRGYQSTTRLGLGALTNVTQNVNTGIVTGHLRTMGAMLKQFSPKTRSFVEDTGTISDSVLNDLKAQAGFVGKGLSHITAPGFANVERFNRSVSATAGRDYALRLAQKGDTATLRKLGVTGDIKGNTLTHEQQVQAARKVVEKTQFKVDPQDLPGWADSPGGKLVSQFRTFSYSQGKFFSNEILKPAAKGNLLPLGRLLAALPVGYAMYDLKQHIAGRPLDPSKKRQGIEAFGNVGGAGLAVDIFRGLVPLNGGTLTPDRFTSMAAGTLGGPTVGGVVDLAGGAVQAVQKKNLPQDPADLNGKAAIVSGNGYYDPTTLARFGLRQIPVVGTAIQNRVLPYAPKTTLSKNQQEQLRDLPKDQQAAFVKNIQDQKASASQGRKDKAFAAYQESKGKSTGLNPVDQLAFDKKKQGQSLKNSLSPEDYKLSKLSKTDRQKLVDSGAIPQAKFDGLDSYVNNEKKKLGMTVAGPSSPTPAQKYKTALDKFNKNQSTMTDVQKYAAQSSLNKMKVQAPYSSDVISLYDMSKPKLYDFLTSNSNGKKLYDQLKAYDQAQLDAGLIKTSKFKYGLESASSSKGSKGSAKGNPYLANLKYNIAIKPPKAPNVPKPGKLAAPGKVALKKFTPKQYAISKGSKISVRKGTA